MRMKKGLAYLLTTTMVLGMLLGVPAKGSVVEAATAGGFTITGGTEGIDYSYNSSEQKLSILSNTAMTITTNSTEVKDYIYIGSASGHDVNLTLSNVKINRKIEETSVVAGILIADDYAGDVTLNLSGTNRIYSDGGAGIQKNGNRSSDSDTSLGTLKITGSGSLEVVNYGDAAAIGSTNGNHTSNIQIDGGTLNVYANTTGAAIGGGANGDGKYITINGGTITALVASYDGSGTGYKASLGAAIGGGSYGSGEDITITGGTVKAITVAKNNSYYSSYSSIFPYAGYCSAGAGIGGGYAGNAKDITISGGTVTAYGGEDSAGIGSGALDETKEDTNILISGGFISAQSNQNYYLGAGIGGGSKSTDNTSTSVNVTITGGTIGTVGATQAPGIGAGAGADSNVYISGGSINATAGTSANDGYTADAIGLGASQKVEDAGKSNPSYTSKLVYSAEDNTAVSKQQVQIKNANSVVQKNTVVTPSFVYTATGEPYYGYGTKDLKTNALGYLYLYLIDGVELLDASKCTANFDIAFKQNGAALQDSSRTVTLVNSSNTYTATTTDNATYTFSGIFVKGTYNVYVNGSSIGKQVVLDGSEISDIVMNTCAVTTETVSNGTITAATVAEQGEDFTFTVKANTGYVISSVSYKVNDGSYQTLTGSNGSYTIPGSAITGPITIKADIVDERGIAVSTSSVQWDYTTPFTYNGQTRTVKIKEDTLPEEIESITYTNHSASGIGEYTATATFTCKTGYYAEPITCTWKIVEYTPSITLKYNDSTSKLTWYNDAVAVSADGFLVAEGSSNASFAKSVTFTSTGSKNLYFKNESTGYITTTAKTVDVQIDKLDPTGSITIGNKGYSDWNGVTAIQKCHLDNAYATFSTSDANSQVKETAYAVAEKVYASESDITSAGLDWKTGTGYTLSNDKAQALYVRITDYAGNVAYISTPLIYNDTQAPTVTLKQTSVTSSIATYSMTFDDEAGNVDYAYVLLKKDDTAPTNYSAILSMLSAGKSGGKGTGVEKTATFSSLSPNEQYVLYAAASDGMCDLQSNSNANISTVKTAAFTTSKASVTISNKEKTIKPTTVATTETYDLKAMLNTVITDISVMGEISYDISIGSGAVLSGTPDDENNILNIPVKANPSGEQDVYITVKSSNYEDITVTLKLVVSSKTELNLSGGSCSNSYTYNGSPQGYTTSTGNYVWKDSSGSQVSGIETEVNYQGGDNYNSSTAPTDVGTYTVTIKIKDNSEYIGSYSKTYTIDKANVDMSAVAWYLDNETEPFNSSRKVVNDGQTHTMTVKGYPTALVTATYSGASGSATGSYKAVVSFALTTTASKNYETPSSMTLYWEIVDKDITKITPDMSNVGWVYQQGNTQQEYKAGETKLIANGSTYSVKVTGLPNYVTAIYDGVTEATEPGDYVAKVTFQVTDSTVYAIPNPSSMTLNWSISEKEVAKTTPDMSKVKWVYKQGTTVGDYVANTTKLVANGTAYTVAVTGVPEGVTAEYSGVYSASVVGDYNATVTFKNADSSKYNNPSVTTMNLTWSIVATSENDTQTVAPAIGTQKEVNGANYKVTTTSTDGGTVEYTGPTNKNATKVTIPATIEIDGQIYKVTTISKDAFKNNKKKLTKVTIKNGILTIGANAFKGCVKLTSITIPNSVTSIGSNAFNGCKKLKTVKLGNGVKTIGTGAFSGCSKLKTVSIGSSSKLTKFGDKAFYKCTSLTKITIPKKVTTIGKQAFEGCKKLKTITIKSTKLRKVGSKAIKNINKKATIKCPSKKYVKKYKKLFKSKTGYKKTMKIK